MNEMQSCLFLLIYYVHGAKKHSGHIKDKTVSNICFSFVLLLPGLQCVVNNINISLLLVMYILGPGMKEGVHL